jgi:hypothetical protein
MTSMLQGHLDTCNEMGSSGWAWCPSNPAATVEIVYQIDESTPNFVPAQEFRTDLRAAGIGDGGHGFKFEISPDFFDGREHTLRVYARHAGIMMELAGSPKAFCLSPEHLITGDFELGNDGLLQGWVIDRGAPSRILSVDVMAVGIGHRSVSASMYRSDLLKIGDGSGKHGFQTVLPGHWYSHRELSIQVLESNSGKLLSNGPVKFDTTSSYFKAIQRKERPPSKLKSLYLRPTISVILPVYNPPPVFLEAAIQSVKSQAYPYWQLCIADDASPDPEIKKILERHASEDERIEVMFRKENGHICQSSNSALALARGEFIALLDHDDLLHPDALLEIAHVVNQKPDIGMIFSDEDKCDEHGTRYGPYRKMGWDPELLLGQNCVSHLGVYRTELVRALGGFRPGYEGSQDYDLALRASRALTPAQIHHIPRILYHWRAIPGSTALANSEKSYAVVAMHRALRSHLEVIGSNAACEPAVQGTFCRVTWPIPSPLPAVTIILPLADTDPSSADLIANLKALQWGGMQILAGDVRAIDPIADINARRLDYLRTMLAAANGEVCIWLERVQPLGDLRKWLGELISQALRNDIGIVGTKLLDPMMKVAMAGFTFTNPVKHQQYNALYRGLSADDPGHGGGAGLCRTVQAISAHAFASRRTTLLTLLSDPWIARNAPIMTELSLRAKQRNLRTLLTPFAISVLSP